MFCFLYDVYVLFSESITYDIYVLFSGRHSICAVLFCLEENLSTQFW